MIELDQRKIPLTGVRNARDLGGIPVAGNRVVKKGRMIRCGRLNDMTEKDAKILDEEYHVTEIIDLRNPQETIEYPDRPIGQATWECIPLLSGSLEGISKEEGEKPDPIELHIQMMRGWNTDPVEGMRGLYLHMATDPFTTAQVKKFMNRWLCHEEGAFLWHCTAGKDRTGITGALMLWILGAERGDIETEYFDTNTLLTDHLNEMEAEIYRRTGEAEFAKRCTIPETVHPSYIKAYLDTLEETYGSVDTYLRDGLGITEEDRLAAREKYTEEE